MLETNPRGPTNSSGYLGLSVMTAVLVSVIGYPFADHLAAAPGNGRCCGQRTYICCGCQYYLGTGKYVQPNVQGNDQCKDDTNQDSFCEDETVLCFFALSTPLYDNLGLPTINPCSRQCANPSGSARVTVNVTQCKSGASTC